MNLRTPTATKALGGGALAVVALLGWLLLIGPALGAIGDAATARTEAADRNLLMTSQVRTLQAQAEDLPAVRRSAARLARIFPPTADQPGFFQAVSEAADEAGIGPDEITALSPGVPTLQVEEGADPAAAGQPQEGDVAVQTVTISVVASYDEIAQLLERLEGMDRAFLVGAINIANAEDVVTMSITGSTFVTSPVTSPDLGPGPGSEAE